MIKSILCTHDDLDKLVNQWIETNEEYMVLSVNVTYCGGPVLAIINYDEIDDECAFKDTEFCDGECDDCDLDSEEMKVGDN